MVNLLYLTDLHKKMQDVSTLRGYRNAVNLVMQDIFKLVEERQITHIVLGGDWYDSGFSAEVNLALVDVDDEKKLKNMVKGNLYGVIGNHINIKMSSNPELYLIQPHDKYRIRESERIKEQVIKTPEYLELEGVNLYFMHYDWHESNAGFDLQTYHPKIRNNGGCNIAFYHTDLIASKRYCNFAKLSDDKVQSMLEGVDVAICGHIHQPIQPYYIGKTLVWIPGSLTNTKSNEIHNTVNLPLIHIDNGKISMDMVSNFNLHTDVITVKEAKKVEIKKIDSKLNTDVSDEDIESRMMSTLDWLNLKSENPTYDINLCNMIYNDPTNINNMINVFRDIKAARDISKIK